VYKDFVPKTSEDRFLVKREFVKFIAIGPLVLVVLHAVQDTESIQEVASRDFVLKT